MKNVVLALIIGGFCFSLGAFTAIKMGNSASINLLYFPAFGGFCAAAGAYAFSPKKGK